MTKQKKIKPVRAWARVSNGDICVNSVQLWRANAEFVAGLAPVIPVMVVPLETWRALVKKARGR